MHIYAKRIILRKFLQLPKPSNFSPWMGKVAICTDSALVFLGATGKCRKWALNNQVGSRGPLRNVELWKELLHELDSPDKVAE